MYIKQCDAKENERLKAGSRMTKQKSREGKDEAHSPGMEYCSLAVTETEGKSNDISKVQLNGCIRPRQRQVQDFEFNLPFSFLFLFLNTC